jgi:hypothetical protein
MNKKVICVNDTQLPPGAEIKEGEEYTVRNSFINNFDQRAYLLTGIRNRGRTKYGLPWEGYNSTRFEDIDPITTTKEEEVFALN